MVRPCIFECAWAQTCMRIGGRGALPMMWAACSTCVHVGDMFPFSLSVGSHVGAAERLWSFRRALASAMDWSSGAILCFYSWSEDIPSLATRQRECYLAGRLIPKSMHDTHKIECDCIGHVLVLLKAEILILPFVFPTLQLFTETSIHEIVGSQVRKHFGDYCRCHFSGA